MLNYRGIIVSNNNDGTFTVEDWDLNTRTFDDANSAMNYANWLIYREM